MKVMITRLRKIAVAVLGVTSLAALLLMSVQARTGTDDQDPASIYKANKCNVCHGAKAEKRFDPTKPDDELVKAILKGKKAEKPPNMPGFEEKGMTADQAKALVAYMKSLCKPSGR